MKLIVEAVVQAPIDTVWACWTTPGDIVQWNAASADWHTIAATLDLRAGGRFCFRMEAKDGSMGFDFDGTFVQVEPPRLLVSRLGDRDLRVEFAPQGAATLVRETFDAEDTHPPEMQRAGWQAILDSFKRHVEAR